MQREIPYLALITELVKEWDDLLQVLLDDYPFSIKASENGSLEKENLYGVLQRGLSSCVEYLAPF